VAVWPRRWAVVVFPVSRPHTHLLCRAGAVPSRIILYVVGGCCCLFDLPHALSLSLTLSRARVHANYRVSDTDEYYATRPRGGPRDFQSGFGRRALRGGHRRVVSECVTPPKSSFFNLFTTISVRIRPKLPSAWQATTEHTTVRRLFYCDTMIIDLDIHRQQRQQRTFCSYKPIEKRSRMG